MSRCRHLKTAGWFMLFSVIFLAGCASGPANQQAQNATNAAATTASESAKATSNADSEQSGKTANPRVYEFMLDNGMKVLVKQDHRAPVVVSQVWYKAGSSYEQNGSTGVAHVLEHMMF
ncbi:insulinase family protein, partial [Kaarinaea lacus]